MRLPSKQAFPSKKTTNLLAKYEHLSDKNTKKFEKSS